jgi:hypothetical protein
MEPDHPCLGLAAYACVVRPSPPEPLIVDLQPAPPRPDDDVRAWASGQSVFVSSVMGGMSEERNAVVAAIEAVGAQPVWFEAFGGMDDDAEDAYLAQVASSSIYVGLLGARYGRPLKSGYSATHAEYDEAGRAGLRISIWNAAEGLDGRQRDFLEEVRVFHATGTYTSSDDLRARIEARLRVIANEALSPWVKIGPVLLRATEIRDNGRQIVVAARVRDSAVANAIEAMRPGRGLARNTDTRITWPTGTALVRIDDVQSVTTNALARDMTITGDAVDSQSSGPRMSVNGYNPDELTEIALRSALFGETNPLGNMAFMAEAVNPLPQLDGLRVTEDSVGQVARLLIVEELVGRLAAGQITRFDLGPSRAGSRRLRLGWLPNREYTNVAAEPRQIEGIVESA